MRGWYFCTANINKYVYCKVSLKINEVQNTCTLFQGMRGVNTTFQNVSTDK